jgi:spermidine synthase
MTDLAKAFPPLAELARHALDDKRVRVINDDAMVFVEENRELWDAIIIDFPDPNTYGLAKLYTKLFYSRVYARLAPGGAIGLQATSPLFARRAYWCIIETMRAGGLFVQPYQVTVPSFGVWGFALAKKGAFEPPTKAPAVALRFLNDESLAGLFVMAADMTAVPVEVNHLDNQVLVRYYEREWKRWQQ